MEDSQYITLRFNDIEEIVQRDLMMNQCEALAKNSDFGKEKVFVMSEPGVEEDAFRSFIEAIHTPQFCFTMKTIFDVNYLAEKFGNNKLYAMTSHYISQLPAAERAILRLIFVDRHNMPHANREEQLVANNLEDNMKLEVFSLVPISVFQRILGKVPNGGRVNQHTLFAYLRNFNDASIYQQFKKYIDAAELTTDEAVTLLKAGIELPESALIKAQALCDSFTASKEIIQTLCEQFDVFDGTAVAYENTEDEATSSLSDIDALVTKTNDEMGRMEREMDRIEENTQEMYAEINRIAREIASQMHSLKE